MKSIFVFFFCWLSFPIIHCLLSEDSANSNNTCSAKVDICMTKLPVMTAKIANLLIELEKANNKVKVHADALKACEDEARNRIEGRRSGSSTDKTNYDHIREDDQAALRDEEPNQRASDENMKDTIDFYT
jgi:hypothetical protein